MRGVAGIVMLAAVGCAADAQTVAVEKAGPDGLRVVCDGVPVARLELGDVTPAGPADTVAVGYEMLTGKRRACSNTYVEQLYTRPQGDTVAVRVYTDGVAWKGRGASEIAFETPVHTWLQPWSSCYEEFFPKDMAVKAGDHLGYPALLELADSRFALLTESGVTPCEAGTSMYATGPFEFELRPEGPENGGWQVLITGSLADVVESTLVSDVAAPSVLPDAASWVQPGVAAWVYWAYNHGSNDYNIIKKYVDLAHELRLPYVLIDAEWDEMKDGRTVEDAVAYAVEQGVSPMIWYNSSIGWVDGAPGPKFRLNTPEDVEREFAWCERIGVKGVKIDFFSGDSNRNFKFMAELVEAAARHRLLVNFHGSPLPRGWQRTYPNFITTEAVYGAEWYNNLPVLTDRAASHNATLPFTRNVVGSMDYTPCTFSDSQHPHITSDAHELALTALFESGIQHLADRPESLLAQPQEVRDYLSALPAAWDETRLIGGYPGRYVVLARRKGAEWWIAGINGTDEPMTLSGLDFGPTGLGTGCVQGRLFEDAPGDVRAWRITDIEQLPATLELKPRGGFVARVRGV